jgi:hypothetical protein
MLIKYIIILLTPFSIVYLSILLIKYKNNKFLIVIIILAAITVLIGSIWIFNQNTSLDSITIHLYKKDVPQIRVY